MQQPLLANQHFGFDSAVPDNGYRWWYIDAFDSEGRLGMTLILFVGCVFSPYYYRARRAQPADPTNHCSLNAIFYGPGRKRWALTERSHHALERSPHALQVGPSMARWDGQQLVIDIKERCAPIPTQLSGRVTVDIAQPSTTCWALDPLAKHRWWPIAPQARVSVAMTQPGIRWQGHAYVDTNAGVEPLENAFKRWYWLRTEPKDGYSEITYHRILLDERIESLRLGYDADGQYRVLEPLGGDNDLPPTPIWRCPRPFCGSSTPRVLKNFEDTPFYARSKLSLNTADDESVIAMYESVDLERFTRPWVQRLLPFRMPRRGRAPNR